MPQVLDPFHRDLRLVLEEDIMRRTFSVARGGATAVVNSPTSTAENYAAQVAYLQALNDVLDKCEELDKRRHGEVPKAGDANFG